MTVLAALEAPSVGYAALSPILIILLAACIGVLVEAFVPEPARFPSQVGLSVVAIIAAFIAVFSQRNTNALTVAGAVSIDSPALFTMGALLVFALLSTMLYADRSLDNVGSHFVAEGAVPAGSRADQALLTSTRVQTEIFPLSLFALSGMMVFVAANNLLVMFIALEVFSLPLYLMAGLNRRRRLLSQEAAVKYFLLGAFASGFFLYGIALIYGYAGSIDLREIFDATKAATGNDSLLILGLALMLIGLLFKAGVAPFHSWTPDVYQGSPTPVAGFMSAATKFAAFLVILRLMYVAFGLVPSYWVPVVSIIALVSMAVGAVMGLVQTDFKRMLAYSSIAHAGFILVGVLGNADSGSTFTTSSLTGGTSATLFYVATYGLSSIAAFACISLVRNSDGECANLRDWRGMGRRSPLLAATMTILMLSMTGIPLTAGFIGKFQVFSAAIEGGHAWVVVAALLLSAITAVFYFRVIVLMYFQEPDEDAPTVVNPGNPTLVVITVATGLTVFLGIAPGVLLNLAAKCAVFIA